MSIVEVVRKTTTVVEVGHPGVQGAPGTGGSGGAVDSVNGRAGPVVLTSADVGLSNVNNTSDASKPVSTAQAAADTAVATAASNALAAHVAAADPHTGYALESSLAAVATSGAYADLTGKPTLGTAAPLNVAASGDAASGEVVKGSDSRLTDARTPTTHTHTASQISDSTAAGRAVLTAADAAAQRTALGVPAGSGNSTGTNTGDQTNITGNAGTATALQTARNINGVAFDGTANITINAVDSTARVAKAGDTMTGALNWAATQTIASAATTDIGAATSNSVIVSGTTTITGLGTIAAGAERVVQFSGALTLTHNATSLILPGGASITTAAGDVAYFVSLGAGNWRCTGYQKANGQSVASSGGSSNTRWIGAGELIPRATNGAGIDGEELATNKQNLDYLAFDAGTQEFAQASFDWPSGYTTLTATFHWTAASGSGAVIWRAAARCYADTDALDQAFGTAQSVTDTLVTGSANHISAATSSVTPDGTVAAGNLCIVQIDRDATNGSDTLAVDARLIGVRLVFA